MSDDELKKFSVRRAVRNNFFREPDALADRGCLLAEYEHAACKRVRHFHQIRGPIVRSARAFQAFDGFDHLKPVSNGRPQRLIHVGDERDRFLAERIANANECAGQLDRAIVRLHECAATRLHIKDKCITPLSQFLAHDAAGNDGNALHCGRHVSQCVHFSIRRSNLFRLTDHHKANVANDVLVFRD